MSTLLIRRRMIASSNIPYPYSLSFFLYSQKTLLAYKITGTTRYFYGKHRSKRAMPHRGFTRRSPKKAMATKQPGASSRAFTTIERHRANLLKGEEQPHINPNALELQPDRTKEGRPIGFYPKTEGEHGRKTTKGITGVEFFISYRRILLSTTQLNPALTI